jgi:hypothetical protein
MEKVISNIGDKPDVPAVMLSKWQRIVNLMGDVMDGCRTRIWARFLSA